MFVYLLLLKSTLLYSYHPKNRPTNLQGVGWRTQFTYAKEIKKCFATQVDRVLSFSQVVGLGLPQPLTRRRKCLPSPRFWGEGHTRWRERGWESLNSDEGTQTVVLFIYTYFGLCPLHYSMILPIS